MEISQTYTNNKGNIRESNKAVAIEKQYYRMTEKIV